MPILHQIIIALLARSPLGEVATAVLNCVREALEGEEMDANFGYQLADRHHHLMGLRVIATAKVHGYSIRELARRLIEATSHEWVQDSPINLALAAASRVEEEMEPLTTLPRTMGRTQIRIRELPTLAMVQGVLSDHPINLGIREVRTISIPGPVSPWKIRVTVNPSDSEEPEFCVEIRRILDRYFTLQDEEWIRDSTQRFVADYELCSL